MNSEVGMRNSEKKDEREKVKGERREEGKGALRLRSGPSDLAERTDVLEAKGKRI